MVKYDVFRYVLNPSEIIGTSPRTLDYSLYRYIITSEALEPGACSDGIQTANDELMYRIEIHYTLVLIIFLFINTFKKIDEKLATKTSGISIRRS